MMSKLYTGVTQELPMLANTPITAENIEYYLGTSDIDYVEGIASEPMMSSIAHSVCLIIVKDGADIEKIKNDIKENVDPVKWICVSVEEDDVIVDSKGNIVVLIMSEHSEEIHDSFKTLN